MHTASNKWKEQLEREKFYSPMTAMNKISQIWYFVVSLQNLIAKNFPKVIYYTVRAVDFKTFTSPYISLDSYGEQLINFVSLEFLFNRGIIGTTVLRHLKAY